LYAVGVHPVILAQPRLSVIDEPPRCVIVTGVAVQVKFIFRVFNVVSGLNADASTDTIGFLFIYISCILDNPANASEAILVIWFHRKSKVIKSLARADNAAVGMLVS
jgi:hypothetical protein